MEPDWEDVERRLSALTVKQLRELGRTWFGGCLGGASTKRGIARTMTSQMRHWWRMDVGRVRVRLVMEELGV
jgi:hypothetical protein